jgi:hypothetical protein
MSIPSDRVEIKLNILGLRAERIWVRRTLSQDGLVAAIIKKFGEELLLEPANQYALFRKGETQPNAVPFGQIRNELNLWEHRELPEGTRRPSRRLILTDIYGTRYPVCWVPGVIGRESKDQRRPQAVPLPKHSRYPQLTDATSRSYLIVDQHEDGIFTIRIDGDPLEKTAQLRKRQPTSVDGASADATQMSTDNYPLDDGDVIVLVNGDIALTVRIIEPI